MDVDAYRAVHESDWQRLSVLVRRRRLDGTEADELVRLYQSTATDLSVLRTRAPDPVLISELSVLLARSRSKLTGSSDSSWRDVVRLFGVTIPAAFYRVRWWTVGVMVVFLAVAVTAGWWMATAPGAVEVMGTASQREDYVQNAFAAYYDPGTDFAVTVWTNNAWIAAQLVGLGITGVWPVFVLATNAVSVGAAGGLMASEGELDVFLALILPHGLMELTAVFVAGGAGLRLFWTAVAPGPRTRGRALAEEGRATMIVALGLVFVLGISGLVEGFVTGSDLAWWLKIVIGAVVLAAYWVYTLVLGGRAAAAGETGDLSAEEAGELAPTAG
ncbi:stage II sporulation protein M [Paraoerskovia marina]|uniref:stage II sporulation protein M n=1 Tax=Paraoerskovia marina TaxID=545619 RepID=UPI000492427B|nr:stage II sporulation protein M [Paraoerskovia marina]